MRLVDSVFDLLVSDEFKMLNDVDGAFLTNLAMILIILVAHGLSNVQLLISFLIANIGTPLPNIIPKFLINL